MDLNTTVHVDKSQVLAEQREKFQTGLKWRAIFNLEQMFRVFVGDSLDYLGASGHWKK